MIRDLLRRAQRGAGGVLLVDGEPGIGKSLLLRDATDAAAELGFSLAAGAADPLGQAIPFFTLRAVLRGTLAVDDPGTDRPDATAWWITQIRVHLEQRAVSAPVLVCLDDLHWASPVTLTVLRALPRDLKRHPVAWLLARSSTPERAADYMFGLLENDGAARVTLAPLGQDAVAAMLTDAFGAPPDRAPSAKSSNISRTLIAVPLASNTCTSSTSKSASGSKNAWKPPATASISPARSKSASTPA